MFSIINNIQGSHSLTENLTGFNLTGVNIIKLGFVFFLIIISIYLVLDNHSQREAKEPLVLESGFYEKTLKNILIYGSAVATFFSTGLAVKSEILSGKLDALQKDLQAKDDLLNKSITELTKIQVEMKELEDKKYYGRLISHRMENQYIDLKTSTNSILKEALILRDDINNPDLSITDKIINLRKFNNATTSFDRDLGAFKKLSDNLSNSMGSISNLRDPKSVGDSIQSSSPDASNSPINPNLSNSSKNIVEVDDINKASFINWDWFATLSSWEKLAVSLLLSKSILFSALLGLIFNFYGDYLLTRYNIESRFPKLAKIIKVRRSFTRYYFFFDCSLILGVIVLESVFSLFILKISLL